MARSTRIGEDSGPGSGVRGPGKESADLNVLGTPGGGVVARDRSAEGPGHQDRNVCRRRRDEERGFTLAAMMVIMAIMAIALTVAVETVTFQQRREKEEELIFRGNQIVEAIRLFRARNGRFPLALKELVDAKPRVLRKAWKDPMTGQPDWVPVFLGQEGAPVAGTGPGGQPTPTPTPQPTPGIGQPPAGPQGGPIIGVHSRSCADSIKVLDGRTKYCEWKFYYNPNRQTLSPGVPPVPTPPN